MLNNMARFEQHLRDKGIDDFAKYIENPEQCKKVMHPSLLMYVWKGLHVAMMQQPEPLLQEQLADKIGNLVLKLNKDKYVIKFFEIGIVTLARDWNKINQYQIDKFLKLFRILLRKVLQYLVQRRWQCCSDVVNMLERVVILPSDQRHDFPAGPKTHLADILMEEIAKTQIIDTRLDFKILRKFLVPYMKVLTVNREKVYRKAVYEGIFVYLCRQSDAGIAAFADLGEKEVPEEELQRLKQENLEYMEKQKKRRVKAKKPRKLNEMEAAMKKMMDEEAERNEDESDGEEDDGFGSDDDFQDEFDKELSDVEDEEEGEGAEEAEDEDEKPARFEDVDLDPRAGGVNVVLPQLPVDWDQLAAWVGEVAQLDTLNQAQRRKLVTLQRLVTEAGAGVFVSHHPLLEPRAVEREGVDQATLEQALERRQRFEADEIARAPLGVYGRDEKTAVMQRHDAALSQRVKRLLREEEAERKRAAAAERARHAEKRKAVKLQRLGAATQRLRKGVERRQTRGADKRLDRKRQWQQIEQQQQQSTAAALQAVADATQRVFKRARRC